MHTPSRGQPQLTAEQELVASCTTGRIIRVQAYAGTGKTSTLEARARRHIVPTLYVCYNKPIQLAAAERFPDHVSCLTSHKLAFDAGGNRFAMKLGNVTPVGLWLNFYRHNSAAMPLAKAVVQTLNSFFSSTDDEISINHVPAQHRGTGFRRPMGSLASQAVSDAREVWARMQDPQDRAIRMPHDGYLKLWALSRPRLPYKEILLDEAQDTNPVVAKVLLDQTHARILAVGDQFQGIYAWRGASNIMASVKADVSLRLTQSFRFGPAVARTGSAILSALGETRPVIGIPHFDTVVHRDYIASQLPSPLTVICRKNTTVILRALMGAREGKTLEFVGGRENYPFSDIHDAYRLWQGSHEKAKGELVSGFHSYAELQQAAKEMEDPTLGRLVTMIEQEGDNIPALLKLVEESTVASGGQLVLTTVHKAKGLEWDNVQVESDWPYGMTDGEQVNPEYLKSVERRQEFHLLYVATTRARRNLFSPPLVNLLEAIARAPNRDNREGPDDGRRIYRHIPRARRQHELAASPYLRPALYDAPRAAAGGRRR